MFGNSEESCCLPWRWRVYPQVALGSIGDKFDIFIQATVSRMKIPDTVAQATVRQTGIMRAMIVKTDILCCCLGGHGIGCIALREHGRRRVALKDTAESEMYIYALEDRSFHFSLDRPLQI